MRRTISKLAVLSLIVSGLIVSQSGVAQAATFVVPSGAFPTIQSAVTVAGPGDTIKVKSGVYVENVVVDNTKTGITITGPCPTKKDKKPKPAIIDAGGTGTGIALDIDAADVAVRCLLLRHGNHGIDADANGITVDRVTAINNGVEIDGDDFNVTRSSFIHGLDSPDNLEVTGSNGRITSNRSRDGRGSCIGLEVNGTLVRGNRVENCDGGGIETNVAGSNNIFELNVSRNMRNDGFEIEGDNNVIRNNSSVNSADDGFEIDGDGVSVLNNVADATTDDECFDVDGDNALVQGNRASRCDGGFIVNGQNPVVLSNRVTKAGGDAGFNIDCNTSCATGRVERNSTEGTTSDDDGFDISVPDATGCCFTIIGNTSQINAEAGFGLSVNNVVIEGNLAGPTAGLTATTALGSVCSATTTRSATTRRPATPVMGSASAATRTS